MADKTSFMKNLLDKIKEDPMKALNQGIALVGAVATAVVTTKAAVDAIRIQSIRSNKPKKEKVIPTGTTAEEITLSKRTAGSVDDKLAESKRNLDMMRYNMNNKPLSEKTLIRNRVLDRIAMKRNNIFKSLSYDDQFELLKMEGFDFKKEIYDHYFPERNKPKLGEIRKGLAFREEVDYGIFNFIMRPLDDFLHWLKEDPTPKRCPQIDLIQMPKVPDLPLSAIQRLQSLHPENNKLYQYTPVITARDRIIADEIFRHDTLDEFRKAVNMRMMAQNMGPNEFFEMLEFDEKEQKSKKKKKKNKSYFDETFSISDDKKKKKKHKDSKKNDDDLDSDATDMFGFYFNKAMNKDFSFKSYPFKIK